MASVSLLLLLVSLSYNICRGIQHEIYISSSSPETIYLDIPEDIKLEDGLAIKVEISDLEEEGGGSIGGSLAAITDSEVGAFVVNAVVGQSLFKNLTIEVSGRTATGLLCLDSKFVFNKTSIKVTSSYSLPHEKYVKFTLQQSNCSGVNDTVLTVAAISIILVLCIMCFIVYLYKRPNNPSNLSVTEYPLETVPIRNGGMLEETAKMNERNPSEEANISKIPESMIGDFKMETSEGFNDLMYELGMRFVKRKIANTLYPTQRINQDDTGQISIDTNNKWRSWCLQTKFHLNSPFKEITMDGRVVTTVAKMEGNKLIKEQIPVVSTGHHTTVETWEILEDGDTLKLHFQIPTKSDISCQCIYKRVQTEIEIGVEATSLLN